MTKQIKPATCGYKLAPEDYKMPALPPIPRGPQATPDDYDELHHAQVDQEKERQKRVAGRIAREQHAAGRAFEPYKK